MYKNIVILTGAGISAESGIKTFRAADGLWENHRIEDVASPEGYARNPQLVQHFYNERRQQLLQQSIQPNVAHYALAKLEKVFPNRCLIVTQNIDNLHERAGSNNVIHMHGELLKMRCSVTDVVYPINGTLTTQTYCDCCQQQGNLRPHIVWFGEMPFDMGDILHALSGCDLFVAIGTSGNVYPAASFVEQASLRGAHTIEINLEPSAVESKFDEHIYGSAGDLVPRFVESILTD